MVQKLVQNYLFQRGNIFYFRYVLPSQIRELCPQLPTEIKRSLRTDSHTTALALVSAELPSIKVLRDCVHRGSVEKLLHNISDFKSQYTNEANQSYEYNELKTIPTLSEAWLDFSNWKSWTDKQSKANQRMFNNLIHLFGDIPVDKVTKADIKAALNHIARLPQRNKKNYAQKDIQELLRVNIPEGDLVSGKYVKEHLKLCQSLFSRYLKYEVDILSQSPTEGVRYEYQDNRYAALNDEQVRAVLKKSTSKQSWFKWFISLSVYSGARRSEILGLHKSDFHYCSDSNRYFFHIKQGRLAGIDTPERKQPFGNKAKQALAKLAFQKQVLVEVDTKDRYGRTVGVVFVDGQNVNAELVRQGMAWVYRKYNKDKALYELEAKAREKELGLWLKENPIPPWEWRRGRR